MKSTEYRCSCCDEVKDEQNHVMREWDHTGDERCSICKECNHQINMAGLKDIGTYLEYTEALQILAVLKANPGKMVTDNRSMDLLAKFEDELNEFLKKEQLKSSLH